MIDFARLSIVQLNNELLEPSLTLRSFHCVQ